MESLSEIEGSFVIHVQLSSDNDQVRIVDQSWLDVKVAVKIVFCLLGQNLMGFSGVRSDSNSGSFRHNTYRLEAQRLDFVLDSFEPFAIFTVIAEAGIVSVKVKKACSVSTLGAIVVVKELACELVWVHFARSF